MIFCCDISLVKLCSLDLMTYQLHSQKYYYYYYKLSAGE